MPLAFNKYCDYNNSLKAVYKGINIHFQLNINWRIKCKLMWCTHNIGNEKCNSFFTINNWIKDKFKYIFSLNYNLKRWRHSFIYFTFFYNYSVIIKKPPIEKWYLELTFLDYSCNPNKKWLMMALMHCVKA